MTEHAFTPESRREGIGGSDAPSVIGHGRYSQLELYAIKTGEMEEPDISDVEWVHFGHVLEETIAQEYVRRTGRKVRRWRGKITHPTHPFMFCHIDRYAYREDGERGVLECKNVSAWLADRWEEEAPIGVQIQLQHNIACTDTKWGVIAALVGGNSYRYVEQERNDTFIRALEQCTSEFWDRVLKRQPPEISEKQARNDARALAALYPANVNDEPVALPPDCEDWHEALVTAKAEVKAWTAKKQAAENAIKQAIGDHTIGYLRDGTAYSWKAQHRDAYEVAPCDFRVLRCHKRKP